MPQCAVPSASGKKRAIVHLYEPLAETGPKQRMSHLKTLELRRSEVYLHYSCGCSCGYTCAVKFLFSSWSYGSVLRVLHLYYKVGIFELERRKCTSRTTKLGELELRTCTSRATLVLHFSFSSSFFFLVSPPLAFPPLSFPC